MNRQGDGKGELSKQPMHRSDRMKRQEENFAKGVPAPGSLERTVLEQQFEKMQSDPLHQRNLKAMQEKANASVQAQAQNGAGLAADQQLRTWLLEYRSRLNAGGRTSLPNSYNVAEAFFRIPDTFYALLLLPERDHLFAFSDFLDWVTDETSPQAAAEHAFGLAEDVIYNVSSIEGAGDLMLAGSGASSFGFVGASLVRRGDELAVAMILGESRPVELDQAIQMDRVEWNPDKSFLALNQYEGPNERQYLPNTGLGRTIALCRFNLRERRIESRTLLRENTHSYAVTIEPADMLVQKPATLPEDLERFARELDESAPAWELARSLTLLPAYLKARVGSIVERVKTTALGEQSRASLKVRRATEGAEAGTKVLYRRIAAIEVIKASQAPQLTGRSYTPPDFPVAVKGFWRTFSDPTQIGHDEQGNPITGKAWVKPHLRHKDKTGEAPRTVMVKASLSKAREQMQRYAAKQAASGDDAGDKEVAVQPKTWEASERDVAIPTKGETIPARQNDRHEPPAGKASLGSASARGSFVYVMRCPAHAANLFKVGFTDRDPELRARELSSSTSSPEHFLVVEAWAVSDGHAAEEAAHKELIGLRLSGRREYFQGPYSAIRSQIESSISDWLV